MTTAAITSYATKALALNGKTLTQKALQTNGNAFLTAYQLSNKKVFKTLGEKLLAIPVPKAAIELSPNIKKELKQVVADNDATAFLAGLECLTPQQEEALGCACNECLGKVNKQSTYELITKMVIDKLENTKVLPWQQPWIGAGSRKGKFRAKNFATKNTYSGINAVILNYFFEYDINYFLTLKQITKLKGKLVEGAERVPIAYYTAYYKNNETDQIVSIEAYKSLSEEQQNDYTFIQAIKHYWAYNAEFIEGIDWGVEAPEALTPKEQIETAEAVFNSFKKGAKLIVHKKREAFYNPNNDTVNMPPIEMFKKEQEYYSTLYHEYIHSTAHKTRLNRLIGDKFGSKNYALEELVAELGASFLCGEAGILYFTLNNSVAYLKGWKESLLAIVKKDSGFIFKAASEAQKAVEYLLQKEPTGNARKYLNDKDESKLEKKKTPVVTPQKQVKANVTRAIQDVLDHYKKEYRQQPRLMGMFYSTFKNGKVDDINISVLKQLEALEYELFEPTPNTLQKGGEYVLTDLGKLFIDRVNNRLQTLKQVKSGSDLFPELGVKEANKATLGNLEGLGATAKTKNSVRWNKLILDAKRKGFKPDDIFELGQPNGIVKKYVGKNIITLSGAVITKSMKKDGGHIAEWHHFINLPDQINKPIAIFESKSKGYVLLIPVITYKNKPLMMSLHIDKSLKVTRIASIYSKDRLSQYKKWADEGLLKYQKKNNGIFDYQTALIAEGSKTPRTKVTNSNNNSKKGIGNIEFTEVNGPSKKIAMAPKNSNEAKAGMDFVNETELAPQLNNVFLRADQEPSAPPPNSFVLNGEIGKLLQVMQPYKYAISLSGDRFSGKSTFTGQLMDCLADNGLYSGWASLEQGGIESKDTRKIRDEQIKQSNWNKVAIAGELPNGINTLKQMANNFDAVIIDSWQKLKLPQTEFDTLRNECPNTIWITIFQENAEGGMRGGNSAEFDSNVILKINKPTDDYRDNYVSVEKNRGNNPDVVYNIFEKKTYPKNEYLERIKSKINL